jgi:CubicO group peptidase (beta-lactamase class C family)
VIVLHLVERGVLRLDEPVAGHLPELAALLSPPGGPPVTLRHLLTHTAGLPDLVDGALDPRGRAVAMDEARFLAAVAAAPVASAGARRAYSSTGVALAGLVAARAAGVPFEELLDRAVLAPLGMSSTTLGDVDAPAGAYGPAGGMRSTADDLARFARFELGLLDAPEVLSPGAVAASQVDDPLPGEGGVAWLTGRSRGEPFVAHTGAIEGHAAAIVLFPRRRVGAVVLLDRLVPGAQCLALSLARVAVDGAAAGRRCLGLAGRLTAAERAAVAALVAAMEDPSADALAPMLSPRLAAAVPAPVLAAGLGRLGRAAGPCRGHSIAAAVGGAVEVRVACARGPLRLRVTFEEGGRGLLAGVQALD